MSDTKLPLREQIRKLIAYAGRNDGYTSWLTLPDRNNLADAILLAIATEQSSDTPYTADQERAAKYIMEVSGIGGGDDPVGFLIASHRALVDRNKQALCAPCPADAVLEKVRELCGSWRCALAVNETDTPRSLAMRKLVEELESIL